MSRKKVVKKGPSAILSRPWFPFAILCAVALFFYWTPLTDPGATPQWDAIDVHYCLQKYFSQEILSLHLPTWTPFTFSGFPFLADPQIGAWYPLNWPFFLIGISPKVLELELFLHCVLAAIGMYLFARIWMEDRASAWLAAIFYAFSGFFAGHSSHIGMFQTAAWLPWLLLFLHRSLDDAAWRARILAGLVGGILILAGHFQTALYSFAAAFVYVLFLAIRERRRWRRAALGFGAMAGLALALSAIQWAPGLVLTRESVRATQEFSTSTNARLESRALATLFWPNALGAITGPYTGPGDVTQFYFYGGLLLIPLAFAGLWHKRLRWIGLLLFALPVWYAYGPKGGLYWLITRLPGFGKVRAPVHIWFVAGFALALLAGAGASLLASHWKKPGLVIVLAVFSLFDLTYWNCWQNQTAYAHMSFQQRYGAYFDVFERGVGPNLDADRRFFAPGPTPSYGPLNASLYARIPVTFGYNPLELLRYAEYQNALRRNAKLVNGMAVGLAVEPSSGAVKRYPDSLPMFYVPKKLRVMKGRQQSRTALETLDPTADTLVEGGANFQQDPRATVKLLQSSETSYHVEVQAGASSLLASAIPWFPGWRAESNGESLPLRIVNHAFMGILVPPGTHEIAVSFHLPYLGLGALASLIGLASVVFGLWRERRVSFAPVLRDKSR